MAFDFPASPAENTIYHGLVFRNGAWRRAAIKTALPKNYLVNPAAQISQENGSATVTSNLYPVDQWLFGSSVASGRAAQGGGGQVLLTSTAPILSAAGTDYVQLFQRIEGARMAELALGSADSEQLIIAFNVNIPVAGLYSVSLGTNGGSHTWLGSFTIAAGEAATWVRKQVIVPAGAINAGTWPTDSNAGGVLHFTFVCGPTLTGIPGFQAGNFLAVPGQALGLSTALACAITNVGLYLDRYRTGIAPPFVMPTIIDENMRCQRYWYKAYGFQAMIGGATSAPRGGMRHPVPMRTTPVGTIKGSPRIYDGGATPVITALATVCNPYAAEFDLTCAAGGLTVGRAGAMYFNTDADYIAMSARM